MIKNEEWENLHGLQEIDTKEDIKMMKEKGTEK